VAVRIVEITSLLPVVARDELERITFFNQEQYQVVHSVVEAVYRYGVPTIVEEEGYLRFRVATFGPVQSLYAVDCTEEYPQLAGVVIFVRNAEREILVLHLAVHEDYTARGRLAVAWVTPRLMAAVRGVALHTRGVRQLRFLYPHEVTLRLRHAEGEVGENPIVDAPPAGP
jgi:hypothetical protein